MKALSGADYEAFVSAGSSSEYGFKQLAMRETDLLEPDGCYAVAKCAQTLLCQHVARTEKKPITTLRIFSASGPWEEPNRAAVSAEQAPRCVTTASCASSAERPGNEDVGEHLRSQGDYESAPVSFIHLPSWQ